MATIFKFLGYIVLTCISSSLAAFTVENRTHEDACIRVFTGYPEQQILLIKASTSSLDNPTETIITLESTDKLYLSPGERGTITLDPNENIDSFKLVVYYSKPWYALGDLAMLGLNESTSEECYNASTNGTYILKETIQLVSEGD